MKRLFRNAAIISAFFITSLLLNAQEVKVIGGTGSGSSKGGYTSFTRSAEDELAAIALKLDLTKEQREKILPILKVEYNLKVKEQEETKALFESGKFTSPDTTSREYKEKMSSKKAIQNKIRDLLTQEQKDKYNDYLEKMKPRITSSKQSSGRSIK